MNISVFKPAGRKNYVCQWVDPITGRKKTRSTGTAIKRDAERFAGNLATELENGTYHRDLRMTWEDFRERFELDYLKEQAPRTAERFRSVFNSLEREIDPKLLSSVNNDALSRFKAAMRKNELSDATIKTNLTHLLIALRWAVGQKFVATCPSVKMPKNTEGMKGRPITGEEFERMLACIDIINPKERAEWEFLLRGLWWSGLRLGEALSLHWTDDSKLCVDLENELIIIQAGSHKGRRYTETPMAPEFADLLAAVPEADREGFVFNPVASREHENRPRLDTTSKLITRIGEAAGVKVAETINGKAKWASAHDLRRAFGFRWSRRNITPAELKELMRHKKIDTTLQYYVGQNAKQVVRRLRQAAANTLANSGEKAADSTSRESTQPFTPKDL